MSILAKIALCFALTAASWGAFAQKKVDPRAFNWVEQGRQALESRDFVFADSLFNLAVQADADYEDALFFRGLVRRELGKNEAAVQDFDRLLDMNVKYIDAYLQRGRAYAAMGRCKLSGKDLRFYVQWKKNTPVAYFVLGSCYAQLKRWGDALEELDRAINDGYQTDEAYYYRGLTQEAQGLSQAAIQDYSNAIRRNVAFHPAYVARGSLYRELGEYDKAVDDLIHALKRDTSAYRPLFVLAEKKLAQGDTARVIEVYTQMKNLRRQDTSARRRLARIYTRIDSFDLAKQNLEEVHRRYPKDADVLLELARFELAQYHYVQTLKYINNVLTLRPDYGAAYQLRGELWLQQGLFDRAFKDLEIALRQEGSAGTAYVQMGRIARQWGAYDTAAQFFTKAIENGYANFRVFEYRCATELARERYDAAYADCSRAIKLAPKQGAAWLYRAQAQWARGYREAALRDATRAVDLGQAPAEAYYWRGRARVSLERFESGCYDLLLAGQSGKQEAFKEIIKNCP